MGDVNGGPAFPFHRTVGAPPEGGMSLRDWFAGQALPMLIDIAHDEEWGIAETAGKAYLMADAMLAARSKEA